MDDRARAAAAKALVEPAPVTAGKVTLRIRPSAAGKSCCERKRSFSVRCVLPSAEGVTETRAVAEPTQLGAERRSVRAVLVAATYIKSAFQSRG
jgi:hypothetical protein